MYDFIEGNHDVVGKRVTIDVVEDPPLDWKWGALDGLGQKEAGLRIQGRRVQ